MGTSTPQPLISRPASNPPHPEHRRLSPSLSVSSSRRKQCPAVDLRIALSRVQSGKISPRKDRSPATLQPISGQNEANPTNGRAGKSDKGARHFSAGFPFPGSGFTAEPAKTSEAQSPFLASRKRNSWIESEKEIPNLSGKWNVPGLELRPLVTSTSSSWRTTSNT